MSDPEVGIGEEDFRTIMRYIIEKDKMLEGLVEKLCHRFRATRTNRQWRDLAFCLSLFSFSDRALRKLSDNFPCYQDKLHKDGVYDCISVIIAGVKKGAGAGGVGAAGRGEAKQLAEELEAKVEEARAKGVEDDTADRRAEEAKKKANEKVKGRKKSKKQESSDDDEDEEEDGEGDEEGEVRERRKSGRVVESKNGKKKGSRTEEDSDDDANEQADDEDDNDKESKRRTNMSPVNASAKKKGKKGKTGKDREPLKEVDTSVNRRPQRTKKR